MMKQQHLHDMLSAGCTAHTILQEAPQRDRHPTDERDLGTAGWWGF